MPARLLSPRMGRRTLPEPVEPAELGSQGLLALELLPRAGLHGQDANDGTRRAQLLAKPTVVHPGHMERCDQGLDTGSQSTGRPSTARSSASPSRRPGPSPRSPTPPTEGSETCTRRPAHRRAHRNSPSPDQVGHQVRRTAAQPPVMTWAECSPPVKRSAVPPTTRSAQNRVELDGRQAERAPDRTLVTDQPPGVHADTGPPGGSWRMSPRARKSWSSRWRNW